ncbi:MAG: ribosomal L7Ae/L30e/S12e/Gadd45 family protein [Lachnospiraceae bacterium]|nr:ribosomal L7Ae/L30e/S12e/Gadd45 family protein [Lachnospiraceae bacterium]
MGLAMRAGKLVSGEESTEKAVKNGSAKLVIVALDASDNTKKLFKDKCSFYGIPVEIFGYMHEMGHALGKEKRASLAFLDKGLADATCKQLILAMNSGGSNNVKN